MANNIINEADDWEDIPVADAQSVDVNTSDDWQDLPVEVPAPSAEISEFSPSEIGKTAIGATVGYGVGKGVGALASKALDPIAENLAFGALGGNSTPSDSDLKVDISNRTKGQNFGIADFIKSIGGLKGESSPSESAISVYDKGVTPRSVGRQVLDEKLLGPLGIGSVDANNSRAGTNLSKKSVPTNALLESIEEFPVHQDSIFRRMKELADYNNLNETVPQQKEIKSKFDKLNDADSSGSTSLFGDIESPMTAERAKRDLQKATDFADPERTVKNQMNAFQSTARKEAVENAVEQMLGPEKLAEFRQLKAKSGSAGVAKNIAEEALERSKSSRNLQSGIMNTLGDIATKKVPGFAAAGLDTVSKSAKALGPGLGALIGATVGAVAADEQTDSADFIPVLDQAAPAGSSFDDKDIQNEVKARQNYDASPAAKDRQEFLRKTLQDAPEGFRNGFAYKQAEKELNTLTDGSKALKQANPDQLLELSQSFKEIKGADKFVAPLENAAQADSEEERRARLFGLYQQPAFRQLLNKNTKS